MSQPNRLFPYGICIDDAPVDKVAQGFEYFELPNALLCEPFSSNHIWNQTKARITAPGRKFHSASHYLQFHGLVGNGAGYDREQHQFWAERSFRRMAEVGVKVVGVYGAFFQKPDDKYDLVHAMDDAISSVNIMADAAEKYGMEIALEPMAKATSLFPRYLDGLAFCKATGRKSVKLMADLNYFLALNQDLEDILKAPDYCLNVHIQGDGGAQPYVGNRTPIFERLFKILKEINYAHVVTSACPWVSTKGGELDWAYETQKTVEYLDSIMEHS